jgi:uncharacterized protein DUF6325
VQSRSTHKATKEDPVADPDMQSQAVGADVTEMGPIDYVVLEWPRDVTPAGVADHIVDLVDRGIVRVLDIAFISKDDDGNIVALDVSDHDTFAPFEGASSGILADQDLEDAGEALEPGTAAAVLIWENRWAAPLATALRKSGAQLVASGRIPVQAILASLEAAEAED